MLLKAKTRLEFDNSWVRQLKFVEHTDQDLAGHVDAISIKSESGSVFDFYRSNPLENPDDFKYTALYNKVPQVKKLVDYFQLQTYTMDGDTGQWFPTKTGFSIPADEVSSLIPLLNDAAEAVAQRYIWNNQLELEFEELENEYEY